VTVSAGGPPPSELLAQIFDLLREAVGEDAAWQADLEPATRLDGDLVLESVEWTALSQALVLRYGDRVDLADFVAGLDIDQIIALTVADVAAYVAQQAGPAAGGTGGR
jgi:acyl carrier protein